MDSHYHSTGRDGCGALIPARTAEGRCMGASAEVGGVPEEGRKVNIGEPQREIIVEPLELPEPLRKVEQPERVPQEQPERKEEPARSRSGIVEGIPAVWFTKGWLRVT